jgi:hypothetical protein
VNALQKLTINEMKALCSDFFFSPDTMRFFRGAHYRSIHKNGQNYIKVTHNKRVHFYRFDEKGKTHSLNSDDVKRLGLE